MVSLFAICILILLLVIGIESTIGSGRLHNLVKVSPFSDTKEQPLVSVVIAARDEEENIASALDSVLSLTYEQLEIIVLNDRSTDATASILDRLDREHE